jgi:[ribosomal protein S5]-alanine N-acetyltransferase
VTPTYKISRRGRLIAVVRQQEKLLIVKVSTANLDLVLQTPDEVLTWIDSLPPEIRAEVSADWIARVRSTVAGDSWSLTFNSVERMSGSVVGNCAFKGPPDAEGIVEVAYYTDPNYCGRGFATEAASGLTEFAFASGQVRLVRAHTKSDNGASARVLTKCGFNLVGEVMDLEDGLVCRWERNVAGTDTTAESGA